jgi:hypothetical protein
MIFGSDKKYAYEKNQALGLIFSKRPDFATFLRSNLKLAKLLTENAVYLSLISDNTDTLVDFIKENAKLFQNAVATNTEGAVKLLSHP